MTKIKSMTAYAVLEASLSGKTYKVHLKAVNHRFLELKCRMPKSWLPFENDAKSLFQKKLERGSLDLWVEEARSLKESKTQFGVVDFFKKLQQATKDVEGINSFFIPPPVRAMILARFPDLWWNESAEAESPLKKEEILLIFEQLSTSLNTVREFEGAQTQNVLLEYTGALEKLHLEIHKLYPQIRKDWEGSYRERIAKASDDLKIQGPSEERILQEVLVLAEKKDVAEELSRIEGHLKTLRTQLESPSQDHVGKRLEFLLQELHREWTTLGNKIQNLEVSQNVVEAKLALEKIREQSLNLV